MEHKNFYPEIKDLHKQIVAEIVALMVEHGVNEVDLLGSSADHAFIIGVPDFDWDCDYMEAEVSKVYYEDSQIKLDVIWDIDTEDYLAHNPNENDDIGDIYSVVEANDFQKVVPCAGIDGVYEAVWQILEENK
jgi:hypothetical protein